MTEDEQVFELFASEASKQCDKTVARKIISYDLIDMVLLGLFNC
jgi:hypothetical protein